MALVLKDRVKETTTTTGTGTITLAGAATGYQSFAAIGNANTTYYCIAGASEWEVGIGTYTASGTTLSRDTILSSSNSNNAVNFSAGTKDVFVVYPAGKSIYDGGPLGTPSSGTVTNLTGTASININGTVGATTPNTGAFTTLQFNSGYGSVATAYGCRAWVNFDGTGTPAIRASGNVTSITDRGQGQWTVNFTTAMPDANYSFAGLAGTPSANSAAYLHLASGIAPTTTALAVDVITDGGTRQDATYIGVSIFR